MDSISCETIGNAMEIVKIGRKTWQIAVIGQICQKFLSPKFFTVW